MGLFDHLIVEYPLPDFPEDWVLEDFDLGDTYQTKSLACNLDVYKLTKDGRLFLVSAWDKSFWYDVYHHGEVIFYTTAKDAEGNDKWLQYKAKFTRGQLANIHRMHGELFHVPY